MRGWAAAIAALAVSCNAVPSQPATPAHQAPQARGQAAMAFDQKHERTLLYGGWPTRGIPYFDTWAWNGKHWADQHPATNPRLWSPAMVYDPARQEIVLFGTTVATGGSVDGVASETWAWDGVNWRQAHPRTPPNARHRAQLVYDSALKEVIMFGGSGFKLEAFTDTWAWNGTEWHKLSESIPGLPDGGVFGAAAYDPAIDRVVLYNSSTYGGAVNPAMWSFDGTSWMQKPGGGGGLPTDGFSMIYDPSVQKLVLFGGEDSRNLATEVGRNLKSDIWLWDGHRWQLRSASSGPRARMETAMEYQSDAQGVLIFGGLGNIGGTDVSLDDTWSWDGVSWTSYGAVPDVGTAVFKLTIDGSVPTGERFALLFPWSAAAPPAVWVCGQDDVCQGRGHTYTVPIQVLMSGHTTYEYQRLPTEGTIQRFQAGSVDLSRPVNIGARYRY
jgi:hypothetical protein